MYSIIDLGSNTVRLSIYQYKNQKITLYSTRKETVGLASYIDSQQRMTLEGIEKAVEVIRFFQNISRQSRVKELFVFATASLRNAVNGEEVRLILEKRTGTSIAQLSGEDEALCDFYGVQLANEFEDGFVVDIGGASTEIVEYDHGVIRHAFAIPIGSLSAYMQYVERIIPTEEELNQVKSAVYQLLNEKNIVFNQHQVIYGVGGTIRATKKLNNHFLLSNNLNSEINRKDIKKIINTLLSSDKEAKIDLIRIIPERVHTILPGMTILNAVAKFLEVDQIVVENYGVREGYLYKKLVLDMNDATQDSGDFVE
jgi:exopolyphosphatase / guanosine-5'-triphosphate,3'-diphosphate pyrophosphatase